MKEVLGIFHFNCVQDENDENEDEVQDEKENDGQIPPTHKIMDGSGAEYNVSYDERDIREI